MTRKPPCSTGASWARFRFSVVGSLLSSPPARGALGRAIRSLAEKTWSHPVTGRDLRVAPGTIARWYYMALRKADDPVGALRRAVRKDCGKISLAPAIAERLHLQYRNHPDWSYQLHHDNLAALLTADPSLGRLRSYSTVKRYMQAHGLVRGPGPADVPAKRSRNRGVRRARSAATKPSTSERSGISTSTMGRRRCSLPAASGNARSRWESSTIIRGCAATSNGISRRPPVTLVHGLSQAIQKRGLPRALLTDNGPAMVAEEVTEGLLRLGIVHERTLPYSPYQNGKQEAFWGTLEGRLLKMLDGPGAPGLTLELLNKATQAWAEIEYNRTVHRETGCARRTASRRRRRAAPEPQQRVASARVSAGNHEKSASERWHGFAGGGAFRDPVTVPSLPPSDRPLRPLGPRPNRSGRRAQWDGAGSDLPSR